MPDTQGLPEYADFRCLCPLRVRWSEVDAQKIVFNGHYLGYFDCAITEYWRALALPYEAALQVLGGELFVKKATLEYHGSARFDELLQVGMRCVRIGTSSLTFQGALFHSHAPHAKPLVTCELVYVFADPSTQTAKALPAVLKETLTAFEAGQPVYTLTAGDWNTLKTLAAPVRQAVFVQEQNVPLDLEWDEDDADSLHVVAVNRIGQAVATARLLPSKKGVAKIGRMAVLKPLRGIGIGQAMFNEIKQRAAARGDHALTLHAQVHARRFYESMGCVVDSAPFEEAGIAHVHMRCTV